jgi:hypothetical protein
VSKVRLRGDVSGAERRIVSSLSVCHFVLEMSVKIENAASCEIRSMIKLLNAKNVRPAEIYGQVCKVYGEIAE